MANRFIFPVGGTPESVRTQIGAVGPAPDPGSTPAPVVGEVLTWDGTAWVPGAGGGGGGITQLTGDVTTVSGSGPQPATVARLQGNAVSSAAPADGQVLTWNGSVWVPGAPASGGSGGGGQIYFLNAGTAGAAPVTNIPGSPLELGLTAEAGQTTVISGALPSVGFSLIAGFVTKVNNPNLGAVPAGLWDFNVWASASALTPNATSFRVKVYVYDPTALPTPTLTLLATSAATQIYDPTQTIQYVSSVVLPQTTTFTTDRIYVEIEGNSTSGTDTITASFGGTTPSHGHTTLPSVSGSGIVHVVNGVIQSPAGPVDLTAGATEISGTLPVGNGGTGTATTPTDGQILIGATATNDYALAALTQGTNVTITNGAGSITIDAVGSIAGTIAANEIAFGTGVDSIGGSSQLEWNPGTGALTVSDALAVPVLQVDTAAGNIDLAPAVTGELRINGAPGAAGEVLTSQGLGLPPVWAPSGFAAYDQMLYVADGADAALANGSPVYPFASISAALASITDATPTKRYTILITAGEYVESGAVNLKPNVFLCGVVPDAVRITATSWGLDATFTGGGDNRTGISNCVVNGAVNLNFTTVTSTAGKFYARSTFFNGAVTLTGYNNATVQAQFSGCQFFALVTVQGVNVGVANDNIHFNGLTLTQSPFGGVPTIWNATGGTVSGTLTATTTVNDFNRRIGVFAKSFWMGTVVIDGPSTYLDYTVDSLPVAGATVTGGANLVLINPAPVVGANTSLSNLVFPTAVNNPIIPAATNATNMGDWGKQWFFSFGYVHLSTGTELYLASAGATATPDSAGRSIFVESDTYGLNTNVNGGDITLTTQAGVSGTGVRGKIALTAREIDASATPLLHKWQSGATGSRPSPLVAGDVGRAFFDTTLGLPIWWNGTVWIDAAGTPV